MAKYVCFIEAFKFEGRELEQLVTYPAWFRQEVEIGNIVACGRTGMHISYPKFNYSDHLDIGDYAVLDVHTESGSKYVTQTDAEDFEEVFQLCQEN